MFLLIRTWLCTHLRLSAGIIVVYAEDDFAFAADVQVDPLRLAFYAPDMDRSKGGRVVDIPRMT